MSTTAKHCKAAPANLVEAIASEKHMTLKHRRERIVWITLVSVSSVAYILDLTTDLPFGFAFQHIEELVLTTGVVRVIGA
jgi:hypothetical protein